jgi:hypothetical protein
MLEKYLYQDVMAKTQIGSKSISSNGVEGVTGYEDFINPHKEQDFINLLEKQDFKGAIQHIVTKNDIYEILRGVGIKPGELSPNIIIDLQFSYVKDELRNLVMHNIKKKFNMEYLHKLCPDLNNKIDIAIKQSFKDLIERQYIDDQALVKVNVVFEGTPQEPAAYSEKQILEHFNVNDRHESSGFEEVLVSFHKDVGGDII